MQLGLAVALLANTQSAAPRRGLVLVIVVFYGSALGRAWEVTGMHAGGHEGNARPHPEVAAVWRTLCKDARHFGMGTPSPPAPIAATPGR